MWRRCTACAGRGHDLLPMVKAHDDGLARFAGRARASHGASMRPVVRTSHRLRCPARRHRIGVLYVTTGSAARCFRDSRRMSRSDSVESQRQGETQAIRRWLSRASESAPGFAARSGTSHLCTELHLGTSTASVRTVRGDGARRPLWRQVPAVPSLHSSPCAQSTSSRHWRRLAHAERPIIPVKGGAGASAGTALFAHSRQTFLAVLSPARSRQKKSPSTQSSGLLHVWPNSQPGQFAPPQSTSLSSRSLRPLWQWLTQAPSRQTRGSTQQLLLLVGQVLTRRRSNTSCGPAARGRLR